MNPENPVVDTYSKLAEQYDDEENLNSCWGRLTEDHLNAIHWRVTYRCVLDVGCGTGHNLLALANKVSRDIQFIGIEPADNMRQRAEDLTKGFSNIRIKKGAFEKIPVDSESVDYLFSNLAFHWTTDLEASVKEIKRILLPQGDMDIIFVGRNNGKEFLPKTTPLFLKYLGPKQLLESTNLRKQLTRDDTIALFANEFRADQILVEERYDTFYDTLEGHWAWWIRAEGHFLKIPWEKREECNEAIRAALSTLETEKGIPYTVHTIHVKRHC